MHCICGVSDEANECQKKERVSFKSSSVKTGKKFVDIHLQRTEIENNIYSLKSFICAEL